MSYPIKSLEKFNWKTDSIYEGDFSKLSDPYFKSKLSSSVDLEIEFLFENDTPKTNPEKTREPVYTEQPSKP